MSVLIDFTDDDYEKIWRAPNGSDYGVQKKHAAERQWSTYLIAVQKEEAIRWLAQASEFVMAEDTYRVVRLSRYPPCSVVEVIKTLTRGA